ncbi:MAG: DUF4912 domain-containing protein [Methylococcaceae bacterium]|nr:DUF4912 domain-containing protein [Methylococcaceae bacterium]
MTFIGARHHSNFELTQEEMLSISQEISLKFTPNVAFLIDSDDLAVETTPYFTDLQAGQDFVASDLCSDHAIDYRFSARELYAISEEISRDFAPKTSIHEPEIFLLPVDPYHLYAYWAIDENTTPPLVNNGVQSGLTLRVYWRPDANPDIKSSNVWFDVSAETFESRLNVRLPLDDTAYSASLGKLNPDHSFDALVDSNIIHLPPAPERIRMTTLQPPVTRSQNDIHSQPTETPLTQTLDAPRDVSVESPLFEGVFYEKQPYCEYFPEHSWFVKLHFNDSSSRGSHSEIDTQLLSIFNEKGIIVELMLNPDFVEPSHYQSKSASGRGI